ncbi:uncharacterized protein LOC121734733 isoform X3 [Aricia agestis]|uniref:uncharacterized protein LOC121734733 isoform X2 n=1 Tax=Aricia agestis TaxID=91739 RepID=UPI001C206396|nr:uncharacterized protein LOC121734733 isoform X2 [Aricia agestis]XP_041981270.1 uncharacterized protein LOC121734733 isoform X3 [Aricia agestis]
MYLLLVFLVVISVVDCLCHDNGNCYWKKKRNRTNLCGNNGIPENFPGSTFEDIGKSMILIDKALKKFCDENNMNITSELHGQDNYILKYQLPEFTNSDFEIKVMNRLIYTTAESKGGNVKAFKDLRILPATIDTSQASWVFEHKTLKVYFPYKTNSRNEKVLYCDDVDEAVKKVPNMSVAGQLGYRSGNI